MTDTDAARPQAHAASPLCAEGTSISSSNGSFAPQHDVESVLADALDKRYRLGSDFYLSVGGVRIDNVYRRVGASGFTLPFVRSIPPTSPLTAPEKRLTVVCFSLSFSRESVSSAPGFCPFSSLYFIRFYAHIAENADFEMRFKRELACIGRAGARRIHGAVRIYLSRQRIFPDTPAIQPNGIATVMRDCGKRSVLAEIRYNKRNRSVALDRIPRT